MGIMATETGAFAEFVTPAIKEGYAIDAVTSNDYIIDIAGVYFPLRTFNYKKNINVGDEGGTGSHLPFTLSVKDITFAGSFSFAGNLLSG